MADVVVEVDVANLAHEGQTRTQKRPLDESEVPRRRDRLGRAPAIELFFEVVGRCVRGKRELEQSADMHRRVARLEHEPCGVDWGYRPHSRFAAALLRFWPEGVSLHPHVCWH